MLMIKKKLSKKKDANFYLPGEEINIARGDVFSAWSNKNPEGNNNGRILFGIGCFAFAYMLVAFRLFGTCVLPNLYESEPAEHYYDASKRLHRADIVDRNGALIATSLPTKDLNANTKYILSPRETSLKLAKIFPDMKFEDIYKKLKLRTGKTYTLRKNLTPHQQSLIMSLGNPGLEFVNNEKKVKPFLKENTGFSFSPP